MGNLFKAHVFKQRSQGEREEVKIKLFNLDDTPLDLLEGGGQGPPGEPGPPGDTYSVVYAGPWDVALEDNYFPGVVVTEGGKTYMKMDGGGAAGSAPSENGPMVWLPIDASAPAPVYGKLAWDFADPNFVPGDYSPISFSDSDISGQGTLVGAVIDPEDDTKIWLPPGIYNYSAWYSVNVANVSGTYIGNQFLFNYTEGSGIYPDGLSVQSGVGAFGVDNQPLPYTSYLDRRGWGIAEIPFFIQFTFGHDFTDLDGGGGLSIARVSSL